MINRRSLNQINFTTFLEVNSLVTCFISFPGLTESIVAAAASRIGKSVLHLDSNEFYGGYWASFNLDNIKIVKETSSNGTDDIEINELRNNSIKLSDNLCRLVNVSQEFHVADTQSVEGEEETASTKWTVGKVMKEFRKFNIDITPKVRI